MGEKKYVFKIDNSKAFEKFINNPGSDIKEEIIGSDFKITCDNCLCDKEIKFTENFKYYDGWFKFVFPGALYFTVVKSENVIDIAKREYGFAVVRSNENSGDLIAYLSHKDGTKMSDDWNTNRDEEFFLINAILDFKDLYNAVSNSIFLLEDLDTHIQSIVEYFTDQKLQVLAKYLSSDQLPTLAKHLNDDQLQTLVDRFTPHQLKILAQELTDPDRIKVIVDTLVTNSEKLRVFAHNMSHQQFTELLDKLNEEELKDVIHKLSDEKRKVVIDDFCKDRYSIITTKLQEMLEKQNKQNEEVIETLRQMKEDMPYFAHNPTFTAEDDDVYPYNLSILA